MDHTPVQRKILRYFETMIGVNGEIPTLGKTAQDNHVSHAAIADSEGPRKKRAHPA